MQQYPEKCDEFLDRLDNLLLERDQWVILAYDQLDRISDRRSQTCAYIRMLLSFWFSKLGRWRRLRAKIFIRTDLLNNETQRFPDSSKLSACKIILEWDKLSLYRLLVRRLANGRPSDNPMLPYLQEISGLITERGERGYEPTNSLETMKAFINKVIGPFMGSNPKKGRSFLWVMNHLQDANGVLAPRSFLKCYSVAAESMLRPENESLLSKLPDERLLHPSMLQGAVQAVSADRVDEMAEDYAWLSNLKDVMSGESLLMSEQVLNEKLESFIRNTPENQLPATNVEGIKKLLCELGILFVTTNHRINMPEIYLHGLGLKRKGGLKRI